jgi:hypothetical protein
MRIAVSREWIAQRARGLLPPARVVFWSPAGRYELLLIFLRDLQSDVARDLLLFLIVLYYERPLVPPRAWGVVGWRALWGARPGAASRYRPREKVPKNTYLEKPRLTLPSYTSGLAPDLLETCHSIDYSKSRLKAVLVALLEYLYLFWCWSLTYTLLEYYWKFHKHYFEEGPPCFDQHAPCFLQLAFAYEGLTRLEKIRPPG